MHIVNTLTRRSLLGSAPAMALAVATPAAAACVMPIEEANPLDRVVRIARELSQALADWNGALFGGGPWIARVYPAGSVSHPISLEDSSAASDIDLLAMDAALSADIREYEEIRHHLTSLCRAGRQNTEEFDAAYDRWGACGDRLNELTERIVDIEPKTLPGWAVVATAEFYDAVVSSLPFGDNHYVEPAEHACQRMADGLRELAGLPELRVRLRAVPHVEVVS